MSKVKIIIVTQTYPPRTGGMQSVMQGLAKKLSEFYQVEQKFLEMTDNLQSIEENSDDIVQMQTKLTPLHVWKKHTKKEKSCYHGDFTTPLSWRFTLKRKIRFIKCLLYNNCI